MQAIYSPTRHIVPFSVYLFALIFSLFVLCVALVMAASPVLVDLANSHGDIKHGAQAEQIRECIQRKGILQEWFNPLSNRRARVCQLKETLFGLQIVQERGGVWQEVTSFLKNKLTRLDQVEQYLRNAGYEKIVR